MIFADYSLAKRLELAESQGQVESGKLIAKLKPELGAAVQKIGDSHAVYVGKESPISRITALGMSDAISSADLDNLEEFYHSRGSDTRIRVCPLADQSLINELNKRHFRIEMFLNAHFREVLSHEQIPESDPAIEFSHLTEADKELWLKMNLRGFEYDIEWMYDITLAKLYNPHTYCILAKVEGEPAGISALSLHEEIAGMHGTSVLPEFRGRGVQTALINYRLKLAQSLKCELIIVDTTPGNNSQRNVERAGFRTAYTRINMVKPC